MTAWLKASIREHPARWGWALNAAFCTLVGGVLSLAMAERLEPAYFATSYGIGFSIHAFNLLAHRHGPPWLPRWAAETVATACGMVLGLALGGVVLDGDALFLLGSNAFLLIGSC